MNRLVKILSILKPQIKTISYNKNNFGESLCLVIWGSDLDSCVLKEIALLPFVKEYTIWIIDGNFSLDISFNKLEKN